MDGQSIALMAVAFGAGGLVKGATGMGLPLIALPVLTTVFGLQHAICIMLVPIIVTNTWQVWRFRATRREGRLAFLPLFLAGGAIGVAIGTWILTAAPERALTLALGLILLAYVALRLARPALAVTPGLARRLGLPVGAAAGALQGATGISAPIGVTFIHAMGLDRDAHVFAVSAMFLLFALAQLIAVAVAGVAQPAWILEGVLALVPILVFMPIGQWLAGRLSRAAFDRMILIFLAAIGLKMTLGI